MDTANRSCGQYEIVDPANFKVKHVQDWPLEKCNGVFGFAAKDIRPVLDWCKDVASLAEKKCSSQ